MSKVKLPHRFEEREYQTGFIDAFLSGKVKRFVLVWHRRSGKDKTTFAHLPIKMFERVGMYYYFAPTYAQGRKIIWDNIDKDGMKMLEHIPKSIVKHIDKNKMIIELVNGSFVQIIGTDNYDSIVGSNPVGCIFTEYSLQNPEVWEFIRPILAENGGWATFLYTPRGMNHGWKLLQHAKANPQDWFWQVLTVDDTQVIAKEVLEQEKKEMPLDLFEQEYYCKFIEGAGSFFTNIDNCLWDANVKPNKEHKYVVGVDLAKVNDETVFTPFNLCTFRVGKQDCMKHLDYNIQKAKAESFYLRYNKAKVRMDGTGGGIVIRDDWASIIPENKLEAFTFTEQSRKDLLVNLKILLEQEKIKIPNDPILIEQLKSFHYELGENGRTRIVVPDGLNDDRVMSLALAVYNIPDQPLKPTISTGHFKDNVVDLWNK